MADALVCKKPVLDLACKNARHVNGTENMNETSVIKASAGKFEDDFLSEVLPARSAAAGGAAPPATMPVDPVVSSSAQSDDLPAAACWSDAAAAGVDELAQTTLVLRADADSQGRYSLDPEQSAMLRQELGAWLDSIRRSPELAGTLLSSVVRDQVARRAVQDLLAAAQTSTTQVWASCLPSGRPVVIATAQGLDSVDRDTLVRRMHHQALAALRDAELPHDEGALSGYERGVAQESM